MCERQVRDPQPAWSAPVHPALLPEDTPASSVAHSLSALLPLADPSLLPGSPVPALLKRALAFEAASARVRPPARPPARVQL